MPLRSHYQLFSTASPAESNIWTGPYGPTLASTPTTRQPPRRSRVVPLVAALTCSLYRTFNALQALWSLSWSSYSTSATTMLDTRCHPSVARSKEQGCVRAHPWNTEANRWFMAVSVWPEERLPPYLGVQRTQEILSVDIGVGTSNDIWYTPR